MFYSLTAKIILPSTISFSSLSLTIIHLPHFGFILITISKAFSVIAIKTSVKPSRVLICCGISRTIYFAHFLLGFAWHAPNHYISFNSYSFNCCNINPFIDIKTIPILIYATFPTVICNGSVAFVFFL